MFKKGHTINNGRKFTKEHKEKIGLANKGKKKHYKSNKIRLKVIKQLQTNYWLGKKRSLEDREKMRKAHIGKKLSKETKKKISEFQKGNKHWNWQGGKSYKGYGVDWTETLRKAIRERDNYTCQECGIRQEELIGRFKVLDVHHIDYNKKNCNPNNLITLCKNCHMKLHNKKINRK